MKLKFQHCKPNRFYLSNSCLLQKVLCCIFLFIFILNCKVFASEISKTVTVLWSQSAPFIYKDDSGKLMGIEVDILELYKQHLKECGHINLTIEYKEINNFAKLINTFCANKNPNIIGSSAFSITEERKKIVDFSKPYMSDISLIISNSNVAVAKTEIEFAKLFSSLNAVTIKGTTYESDLRKLITQKHIPFSLSYISTSNNVLKKIEKTPSSFGYIDLFVYLLYYKENPSITIHRQKFYISKKEGYAYIYPKKSNWKKSFDTFMEAADISSKVELLTRKYLDVNVYNFLDSIATNTTDFENSILHKEKEIQSSDLISKNEMLQYERKSKLILLALLVIGLFLVIVIYLFYRSVKRNHFELFEQKQKIEQQQKDIENKNLQLEKKNERLIHFNDEKNNLMRILAHDLRTPLSNVQGLVELLLLSQNNLNSEQKELLKLVKDSAIRMNKMMTGLLDVEAIEKGKSTLIMEEIDLAELVKRTVKNFAYQASQKQIDITVNIETEKIIIVSDYIVFTEVLENLISNAIKFSFPENNVIIHCKKTEAKALISVTDFGVGMTEDDLPKLYIKFKKLSSKPTGGESSTGLGLSITKQYVEQLGGEISCKSTINEGTTFTLKFPILDGQS